MVSSALGIDLQELLDTLDRLGRQYADDPEYQRLRRALPEDWPF